MNPTQIPKTAPGSFLSLLQESYGSDWFNELQKAQEFNQSMRHNSVMPEVRQNLSNLALLNKPVTVAREGTFAKDGQARFMTDPKKQKQEKVQVAQDNIYAFRKESNKEPADSVYKETEDGSSAFSYAPLDLLDFFARQDNPAPIGSVAVQIPAEGWPGVLSELQRKQFKKTKQRFTPETFNAYLDSQKDVPWSQKFQEHGEDGRVFRVLNMMRDGYDIAPPSENERFLPHLKKSQEFYQQLIENLPGIVQNEHPTAKQLFG
jgi:hypothetical protein